MADTFRSQVRKELEERVDYIVKGHFLISLKVFRSE